MEIGRAEKWGTPGLWERLANRPGFLAKTITAVPKRGKRLSNPEDQRRNPVGVPIAARFIKIPGFQATGVPPVLCPDEGLTVEVTSDSFEKTIGEMTEEDLVGMPPLARTREGLRHYLALIDNIEPPADDEVVTVWRFKYLPHVAV